MTVNKALLESYLRHLGGALFSAIATVSTLTGQSPLDFSSGDWYAVANALWVAILPVLVRFFNKKDPAFGKVAEAIGEEVGRKLKAKSKPRKKKDA
jgi:hypothetical protein